MELGITSELDLEWICYITGPNRLGIILVDNPDRLVWAWNNLDGQISAKLGYKAIAVSKVHITRKWWLKNLWNSTYH